MSTQERNETIGAFDDTECIAEIQQAIREADAGDFARDAEVAAVRAKWKCDGKQPRTDTP